ncbi:MAG: mannosyltransferase [Dehalococcoidia bacterium]
MAKQKIIWLIIILSLSLPAYIWTGYETARTAFGQLLILYIFLSGIYLLAIYRKTFDVGLPVFLGAALILRLSLMFMVPNLTDDYFRYVWDGLLFNHGYNPYLILPSQFIHGSQMVHGITADLYERLNSPDYLTVYPPLCQFLFGLGTIFFNGDILINVIVIRLVIIFAELGTIILLYKLANKFNVSPALVAIYAFNPLVIIELTGNIHPEAIMIFFLVLAVYLLVHKRHSFAAVSFGLAVSVKLLPLIFLPLLIKRLGLIKSVVFYVIVLSTFIALFIPFFSADLITHYFSALSLYFQKFEFNASIYYLLRWVGYQVTGYNTITVLGIILAIATFLTIIAIAFREKVVNWQSIFRSMLMCGTVYFLLATTVHPWYITSLVLLSVFTRFRYPVAWSVLIILSYATYLTVPYSENLWLVGVEYIVLGGWIVFELFKKNGYKSISN